MPKLGSTNPSLATQLSKKQFSVLESDRTIDPKIVHNLLRGPEVQTCIVYRVRNAIPLDLCDSVRKTFAEMINQSGGMRSGDRFVNVHQIGATQFGRSATEYMTFSEPCSQLRLYRVPTPGSKILSLGFCSDLGCGPTLPAGVAAACIFAVDEQKLSALS